MIASPLLGWFIDHFSPTFVLSLMAVCGCTGLCLLLVSIQYQGEMDWLLYLAFILIAFHTIIGGILTVKTGFYFQGRTRSRAISALNALFDAGAVTYWVLWKIHNQWKDIILLIGLYFGLSVIVYSVAIYLWRTTTMPLALLTAQDNDTSAAKNEVALSDKPDCPTREPQHSSTSIEVKEFEERDDSGIATMEYSGQLAQDSLSVDDGMKSMAEFVENRLDENHLCPKPIVNSYIPVSHHPSQQQLLSKPFLFLIIFFACHLGSNTWVMSTTRSFLAYLGDDDNGNLYLTIFTLLMPASVCGLPFVDQIILRFGFKGGFYAINVLNLAFNIIKVTSTNLPVQAVGFVIFAFFRCFLFSIVLSYLPVLLSEKVVGKASGILYACGSILGFLNIPLANLAVKRLDGNFFVPNMVWTAMIVPCTIAACLLGQCMDQELRYLSSSKAHRKA